MNCPFCGAKPRSGSTSWFKCGTLTDPKAPDREDQTVACIETEVGALKKQIKLLQKRDAFEIWNKVKESKP